MSDVGTYVTPSVELGVIFDTVLPRPYGGKSFVISVEAVLEYNGEMVERVVPEVPLLAYIMGWQAAGTAES